MKPVSAEPAAKPRSQLEPRSPGAGGTGSSDLRKPMSQDGLAPLSMPEWQTEQDRTGSRFQSTLMKIGDRRIALAAGLLALILVVALLRGARFPTTLELFLSLLVVAMIAALPAVLSAKSAAGARLSARKKAIVTRLSASEECGGETLCSDETGNSTRDELILSDPFTVNSVPPDQALLYATLALQAKATIERARQMRMSGTTATGDQVAIGRQPSTQSELGPSSLDAIKVGDQKEQANETLDKIARVFPEHRYYVDLLQKRESTGMAGDGLDDAPSPQKADSGSAASGDTDGFRAIASIVLVADGLSILIDAIRQSCRVF